MIPKEVFESNMGLIWKIASNFYGIDSQDLFQAGALGLAKAYKNYQKNGMTKFSTYAYEYIFGEMYALANNKNIKVGKDILKRYKYIERMRYELAQKLMRVPTNIELANYLEIDIDVLEQALLCAYQVMSLDDDKEETRSLHETIAKDEAVSQDDIILLEDSMSELNNVEKDIINSRYYEDLTQSQTARKLGISQVKVSRYEKKGLVKMRKYIEQ